MKARVTASKLNRKIVHLDWNIPITCISNEEHEVIWSNKAGMPLVIQIDSSTSDTFLPYKIPEGIHIKLDLFVELLTASTKYKKISWLQFYQLTQDTSAPIIYNRLTFRNVDHRTHKSLYVRLNLMYKYYYKIIWENYKQVKTSKKILSYEF